MSDLDPKTRIVVFLTKHGDWYHFSERQKLDVPDFDQAIAALLAESRIRRIEVNDRVYFQIKTPELPGQA
jgi:hypothetical protein